MQKTILNLSREYSIIIISSIIIVFTFLNSFNQVNNIISFIFVALKSLIFLCFPLYLYIVEKNDVKFKKVAGIYTGYFVISLLINVIFSILNTNIFIPNILDLLFWLSNLVILLSSLLIIIEQILCIKNIENNIYFNYLMKIVYLLGDYISNPILKIIDKRLIKTSGK